MLSYAKSKFQKSLLAYNIRWNELVPKFKQEEEAHRMMLLKMVLKCSDISFVSYIIWFIPKKPNKVFYISCNMGKSYFQ